MLDFVNALDAAFQVFAKNVYPHAPFYGVMLVLLIVGDQMSSKIFTKERAYRAYAGPYGRMKWRTYFWGRETLAMQPILMGCIIGLSWLDPEGKGWNRAASVAYFATAGAASMVLWSVTKAWAKRKGIVLTMPGASGPPAGHPSMPYELEPGPSPAPEARALYDIDAQPSIRPTDPVPGRAEDTARLRIQPLRAPTITRIERKDKP